MRIISTLYNKILSLREAIRSLKSLPNELFVREEVELFGLENLLKKWVGTFDEVLEEGKILDEEV